LFLLLGRDKTLVVIQQNGKTQNRKTQYISSARI